MTRAGTDCRHHMGGYHPQYRQAIALASLLLLPSACSRSSSTPPSPPSLSSPSARAQRLASATGAPLRAASPWLLMQDSHSGAAVWPSGTAFLLLHTADGWRHVTNITPVAVPTGGGLTMSARSRELVVAALPFDRLVVSPLLRSTASGAGWSPGQLPDGLTLGRESLGLGPRGVTAVLRTGGGTVVERAPGGWSVLTTASRLVPGGHLQLDAISWGVGGRGWVTGHRPAGGPVAFTTDDSGKTWAAVVGLAPDAVAALTPCGGGQTWMLPVVRSRGTMSIARSVDGGTSWAAGAPLTVPLGLPAWGCHDQEAWMIGAGADGDHFYSSVSAGRTWTDHGVAPGGVTDLEPTGSHTGFATTTTSKGAILWAVLGDGASFSPIALPGWVANVGNQMMSAS
jgi:hypothetical protein